MMIVRIVACKHKTPVSWLIRKLCNSPYSHLGIKTNCVEMRDADWGGVKRRRLPKVYDEFYVEMGLENWKIANRWLHERTGDKYDFLGAIGTAVFNAIGKKREKNILSDPYKWTCSELVYGYFLAGGVILKDGVDIANFHPGHICFSKAVKYDET